MRAVVLYGRMTQWTLNDIPWNHFDATKVTPEMLSLAKAASVVEANSRDYARYLCEVFAGDDTFCADVAQWAEEEVQHGQALRIWAETVDPAFNFEHCFRTFASGYRLPQGVETSVRGSRAGELIARCVVEVGTSSYYSALKEATEEPVFAAICTRIAADEFRHYKLFYMHLKRYLKKEHIGLLKRLSIVWGRIAESEDDELAFAFYATHDGSCGGCRYNNQRFKNRYFACAFPAYRKKHVDLMTSMALKAAGIKPRPALQRVASHVAWRTLQARGAHSVRALAT